MPVGGWVWQQACSPGIQETDSGRQEFKASLGDTVSSRMAWAPYRYVSYFKNKKGKMVWKK